MTRINSPRAFEKWLGNKSPALAAEMASRISLRVLPLAMTGRPAPLSSLALFRANTILRSAGNGQDYKFAILDASAVQSAIISAHAAVRSANSEVGAVFTAATAASNLVADQIHSEATNSGDAAHNAAAYAAQVAASAVRGAALAAHAPADAVADVWQGIANDCLWWDQAVAPRDKDLIARGLWPKGQSSFFGRANVKAHNYWLREQHNWRVWIAWYERRLEGHPSEWGLPPEQDAEMARRLIVADETFWECAENVNAMIGEWLQELATPINKIALEPEPQNDHGLIFHATNRGAFEVSELAGANRLLTTPEACDFHSELKETLHQAANLCDQHNQAKPLADMPKQVAELMGNSPTELCIGRFMQRAERCLKLAEAMALELRDDEELAKLPRLTQDLIVVLEAIPAAYWAMVHFDPELDRLARNLKDDLATPKPGISIANVNIVIQESVGIGILNAHSGEIVAEMAEGIEVADSRRQNRYWETVRNFPRAVLSWLWDNKGIVAGGIGGAVAGIGTAAKWIIEHSEWLHQLFANNPRMVSIIDQLIEWARMLPLG